jgi:DNA-binding NarL/FixJ family response regulator
MSAPGAAPVTVLIIDDEPLARASIAALLADDPETLVVAPR